MAKGRAEVDRFNVISEEFLKTLWQNPNQTEAGVVLRKTPVVGNEKYQSKWSAENRRCSCRNALRGNSDDYSANQKIGEVLLCQKFAWRHWTGSRSVSRDLNINERDLGIAQSFIGSMARYQLWPEFAFKRSFSEQDKEMLASPRNAKRPHASNTGETNNRLRRLYRKPGGRIRCNSSWSASPASVRNLYPGRLLFSIGEDERMQSKRHWSWWSWITTTFLDVSRLFNSFPLNNANYVSSTTLTNTGDYSFKRFVFFYSINYKPTEEDIQFVKTW